MTRPISAFIPLKGHSARVPGKNLRDFNGRPLTRNDYEVTPTLALAVRVNF